MIVTTGGGRVRILLAVGGWRPEMLLNSAQNGPSKMFTDPVLAQTLSSDPFFSARPNLGPHPVFGLPSPVLAKILMSQFSEMPPPPFLISDHP